MQITIDIETIPSQQAGARDHCRASIKPPGTLKKPESIAAWWKDEADSAVEDAYRKQSLDGGLHGEIISIAIAASDDDAGWVYCRKQGEAESLVLEMFACAVRDRLQIVANRGGEGFTFAAEPYFIAHNASFDLGYIWRRTIVNGVRLGFKFPTPAARSGKDYGDTMLMWAGFGNRVSLDALCRALSVPSPKDGGIDGAGVYDAWLAGEHERIAAYNLRDTLATRDVWHRLNGGKP
jgi:hypothetical protein